MSQKAFRTQLRPTEDQIETFLHWAKIRRGVYNWGRSVKKTRYERHGESVNRQYLRGLASDKKERPGFTHWSDPPFRVIYYALKDVIEAFDGFFDRVERGETPGYPGRSYEGDPTFSVYGNDSGFHVREGEVKIPCLDEPVALEEKGYIPTDGNYNRVTIKKDAHRWIISVGTAVENPIDESRLAPEGQRPDLLAVHPGVRVWVAMREKFARTGGPNGTPSGEPTGEPFGGELPTEKTETDIRRDLPMDRMFDLMSRVDRQQRTLSRREYESGGWHRARQNLARTFQQLRHLRQDATHKMTATICYDIRPKKLIIQDWNVADLMEQPIGDLPRKIERTVKRRMANANIGELKDQLKYKAGWAGVEVVEVPMDVEVSQRCSRCGTVNEDLGGSKILECKGCGLEIEREVNALNNYFLEHEAEPVAA